MAPAGSGEAAQGSGGHSAACWVRVAWLCRERQDDKAGGRAFSCPAVELGLHPVGWGGGGGDKIRFDWNERGPAWWGELPVQDEL